MKKESNGTQQKSNYTKKSSNEGSEEQKDVIHKTNSTMAK